MRQEMMRAFDETSQMLGDRDEVVRVRCESRMIVGKERFPKVVPHTEKTTTGYTYMIHKRQSLDIY
jgi:hypothetical protein